MEQALFSLSEDLAREHEVEVVCSARGWRGKVEREGRLAIRSLPTWFTLFSTPITPSLVGFLRKAKDFDIIQLSLQNPMACLAYLWARPKGKLIVWYQHDIVRQRVLGRFIAPLIKAVLKKAARRRPGSWPTAGATSSPPRPWRRF
jgi:hypothetical protein